MTFTLIGWRAPGRKSNDRKQARIITPPCAGLPALRSFVVMNLSNKLAIGLLFPLFYLLISRIGTLDKRYFLRSAGVVSLKSPSSVEFNCSCSTTLTSHHQHDDCCERVIWRTHKFGTILIGDLFQALRKSNAIQTQPTPKSPDYSLPVDYDYRHLLVTRNWFDAIVSGYLYHRAGYECWIDPRGESSRHHHSKHYDMQAEFHNKFWDTQHLAYHRRFDIPYPPRTNRSLCQYLQEESTEDGIKVVMDIALSRWYKGVVAYHEQSVAMDRKESIQRSLFVCYEDLVDAFQQEQIFYHIVQHMFPGLDRESIASQYGMPASMQHALAIQQQNNSVYNGSHASSHNKDLRQQLFNMVVKYDRQLFNHTVATSNAVFGCDNRASGEL